LYKAVHVFLASRKVPCTDSKTAVPLHVLLRALRSPLCAGVFVLIKAAHLTSASFRSKPVCDTFQT
jgi:hypothetical protein